QRTSFHHQPEAQHLISSAIHKPSADYPILSPRSPTLEQTSICDALAHLRSCPFRPVGQLMNPRPLAAHWDVRKSPLVRSHDALGGRTLASSASVIMRQ